MKVTPPPETGSTFTAGHLPLSQQVDGVQLLVDSGSSKHFIDPKLICGVESRMLEYTRIKSPMEIRAAGDNVLHGTAQGILLGRSTRYWRCLKDSQIAHSTSN